MKRLILTAAAIFVLLTAAGMQGNAKAEVIYGCYQKNHGQLRVVSNPDECLKSEIPIILGQSLDGTPTLTGEHCWGVSNTVNGGTVTATLRLGFSYIGIGNYLCSGIFGVTYPIDMKFPTFGNAEFADGKIYLTLSLAGIRNGVIGNDIYKVILNPVGLNGTLKGIGVYKVENPASSDAIAELTDGVVTNIQCP